MKKLVILGVLAAPALWFTTTAAAPAPEATFDLTTAEFHLALKESAPKADEMLNESPSKITLWFTQEPQMSGTSVRLLPKGGEPLDLAAATATEEDGSVIVLEVGQTLAAGEYQVMWRAMAQDGHTIRGDFGFMVHAQ